MNGIHSVMQDSNGNLWFAGTNKQPAMQRENGTGMNASQRNTEAGVSVYNGIFKTLIVPAVYPVAQFDRYLKRVMANFGLLLIKVLVLGSMCLCQTKKINLTSLMNISKQLDCFHISDRRSFFNA